MVHGKPRLLLIALGLVQTGGSDCADIRAAMRRGSTGFAQFLSVGRRNKMVGISEQYQYILCETSIHLNFGIDTINQIKSENPHLVERYVSGRGPRQGKGEQSQGLRIRRFHEISSGSLSPDFSQRVCE